MRSIIDIRAAGKAYEKIEIMHLGWMNSRKTTADGLAKLEKCEVPERVLGIGMIDLEADKWV